MCSVLYIHSNDYLAVVSNYDYISLSQNILKKTFLMNLSAGMEWNSGAVGLPWILLPLPTLPIEKQPGCFIT